MSEESRLFPFRAPSALLDDALSRATAEGATLAMVLRLFLQRYVEGTISLADVAQRRDEDIVLGEEILLYELRLLEKLDHPGIGRYTGLEKGKSLSVLLQNDDGAPLSDDLVFIIMKGLLQVLDYLHRQGVVHRGVAPSSILLSGDRVQISRLNLAYVEGDASMPEVLREGHVVGIGGYMAPEQIRGKIPTWKTDLYAAGVVFFQLVTGRVPFPARTVRESFLQHLDHPAPDPRSLRWNLRPEVAELILEMLHKDPELRPASAAKVLARLNEIGDRLAT